MKTSEPRPIARPSPQATSVAEAFVRARKHGELAALFGRLIDVLSAEFSPDSGSMPKFLLQRTGEGPRPASLDAIMEGRQRILGLVQQEQAEFERLLRTAVSTGEAGVERTELQAMLEELRDVVVPGHRPTSTQKNNEP